MDVGIERIEGRAMTVNSFLVHGQRGLVLVDGRLTVSDAVRAGDHGPVRSAMVAAGLVARDDLQFLIDLSIEPVAATLDRETA